MRKTLSVLVACATLSSAAALRAEAPPDVHKRALEALSEDLLYPEKTKVRGLASARSPDGTWTTCGYVFPMSPTGVRDRQWSFMVKVARDNSARVTIARDENDFAVILKVCQQRGVPVLSPMQVSEIPPQLIGAAQSAPPSAPPKQVAELIEGARELDRRCRGTEGANPKSDICDRRNAAFDRVSDAGWCYGKQWQAGYQYEWHACESDSNR